MRLAGEIILVWLLMSVSWLMGWVAHSLLRPRVTDVQYSFVCAHCGFILSSSSSSWVRMIEQTHDCLDTRETPKPPPTPRSPRDGELWS